MTLPLFYGPIIGQETIPSLIFLNIRWPYAMYKSLSFIH